MQMNLSREYFRLILELQKNQPWIVNKVEELENLLYSECPTDKHRELIIDLINRFNYLSHENFSECLKKLANDIKKSGFTDETTQIVAMAGDTDADSSQLILYLLKPELEKLGWRKYLAINRHDKFSNAYKNIILIDEFLGTGGTASDRIKNIIKILRDRKLKDEDYFIKIKVLVATKQGINKLKSEGIDISSIITINKGISDYHSKELIEDKLNLMKDIESILSETYQAEKINYLPKLGYGECESLYCRDDGNTPNNVFPIFWWKFYKDKEKEERKTLLHRAMGDACKKKYEKKPI